MGFLSGLFGGNETSSNTTTATTTTNTDRRQVNDGGSVGVSSDESTVYVTATDLGAIQASLDLAATSSKTAAATIMGALGIASDSLSYQQSQFQQAAEDAAAEGKGWLSKVEPKQWALAGLALFGLVLVMKKGG